MTNPSLFYEFKLLNYEESFKKKNSETIINKIVSFHEEKITKKPKNVNKCNKIICNKIICNKKLDTKKIYNNAKHNSNNLKHNSDNSKHDFDVNDYIEYISDDELEDKCNGILYIDKNINKIYGIIEKYNDI